MDDAPWRRNAGPMHCDYWQLTHDPFRTNSLERAWFPAGDHDEALSRMLYVIERRCPCGLIWGGTGLGKSRLLHEIHRNIPRSSATVLPVDLTGLNRSDFALALVNTSGTGLIPAESASTAWSILEDWLLGRAAMNMPIVWLFDALDAAGESIERDVLRLARLAARAHVSNTIIVTLQNLGLTEQIAAFADFKVELTPWTAEESREFVLRTLLSAGGSTDIIAEDAWDLLLDAGQGHPQRLLRMLEVALIAGSVMEAPQITAELLAAVVNQLGWSEIAPVSMLSVD